METRCSQNRVYTILFTASVYVRRHIIFLNVWSASLNKIVPSYTIKQRKARQPSIEKVDGESTFLSMSGTHFISPVGFAIHSSSLSHGPLVHTSCSNCNNNNNNNNNTLPIVVVVVVGGGGGGGGVH